MTAAGLHLAAITRLGAAAGADRAGNAGAADWVVQGGDQADFSAVAIEAAVGGDRASLVDRAAGGQPHHAAVGLYAIGLDLARIHYLAPQGVRRQGRHNDRAAVDPDQAPVGDIAVDGRRVDLDRNQVLPGDAQRHRIAGREGHRAHAGDDDALVLDPPP